MEKITLVTGLWDIKRSELSDGWNRSFNHYLNKFEQLLNVENDLIIFGDEELKKFVSERRYDKNTQFIVRDKEWFKSTLPYDKIQEIRLDPKWYNQVGWLKESTQAKLEWYNPLVMSKMFLLHDAKILDKFESDYMFWIDAGITNTIHPGYFTHDRVLEKLPKYVDKFSFICFPYETESEIHGFDINRMNLMTGKKVNKVARGGFFGGPKNTISDINSLYYHTLHSTINEGYMGTEESIFSLMVYLNNDVINYFDINGDGLLGTFFENLKNNNLKPKKESFSNNINEDNDKIINTSDLNNTALYIITFNSPNQLRVLLESMESADKDFLLKPKKFLLDNSTDPTTFEEYKQLCENYDFEHIKKDNIGICGGRQFIAEHAGRNEFDYYFFFEDDMLLYSPESITTCINGFRNYVKNLYKKSLDIIHKENFDFLKLSYSELYGDNSTQWSWYNVPQDVREKVWPEKPKLPVQGLDPNAPRTKFNNIKAYKEISYADGDIYYCNWPQIVSKEGNKKMFLNTTWAHPFEQTWMSHIFQETVKGNIKPAILLLSPINHNRIKYYEAHERREN
jgi:hypothetical protein